MVEPENQTPKGNEELEGIVALLAEVKNIENRLANQLTSTMEAVEARLADKIKATITDVEIRLGQTLNPKDLASQVVAEVEKRIKVQAGQSSGDDSSGAGGTLNRLMRDASIGDIVQIIQAWKQPSSDQQLNTQLRLLTTGMSMGQKLKTGELTPKDIQDSFEIKPRE